jgi:hypothetical protein
VPLLLINDAMRRCVDARAFYIAGRALGKRLCAGGRMGTVIGMGQYGDGDWNGWEGDGGLSGEGRCGWVSGVDVNMG